MRSRTGVLAVVLTGVLSLASSAPASAAPLLVMVPDLPIHYPRQAPMASSGETVTISVVVTSSEPVTVTARSHDGGLAIEDPERSFGALPEPTVVSYNVAALEPGFHSFDVQMDGSSGPPYYSVAVSFGFVFATGSPLPAPDPEASPTPLVGYGVQLEGEAPRLLTFVSDRFVHVGLPAKGVPLCDGELGGCLAYWKRSGPEPLVQIGSGIVGTFHGGGGFYSDGLLPPGPHTGTPFGRYDFRRPLYVVDRRTRISGTYAYVSRSRTSGLVRQELSLVKGSGRIVGDFRLSYRYAGERRKTFAGTFRLGKRSAITFRNERGRVVQRGTFMASGRVDTGRHGVLLVLSGRRGHGTPDGNLLPLVER